MTRKSLVSMGLLLAAVSAVTMTAALPGSRAALDRMRREFVALRYVGDAAEALDARPIDREMALARINRALQLAPNHPAVRSAAPDVYLSAGDYPRAYVAMAKLGVNDPFLMGMCLVKMGQQEQGQQLLYSVAEAATSARRNRSISEAAYAMQLNNVAYTLVDAGLELKDATAMLEMATQILPLDPNCTDSLGWAYFRLGEYEKAAFYLERAARQSPRGAAEAEIDYHLGAAYARLGKMDEARARLEDVLSIDPHHAEAKSELRRLSWTLLQPDLVSTSAISRRSTNPA